MQGERRVRTWWEGYWFAAGGRYSLAILRIAIAVSVWLSLDSMAGSWVDSTAYRPVGLWMLAGGDAPSAGVVDALWEIARLSTFAMALGALSRVATALSFVSTALLAGLYYSGSATWSHGFNVVLLAQLALIGGRCGDALAVDALAWPDRRSNHGYQWSIRLVQIAVAMMFASAVFYKLRSGGFSLDWALSDNLRNQLVVRFDARGMERTALAQWIIDDALKFRAVALMNVIAQAVPLFACIFVRRPLVRLACGAVFVAEVVALGLVMNMWDLHWLPLVAVFVDWEWLLRRPRESGVVTPPRNTRYAIVAFVVAFLVVDVMTSFVPRLDQRLNLYPFSGFPMFASIRAQPPYDQHLPYTFDGGQVELVAPEPVPPAIELELTHYYRNLHRTRDREQLHARMQHVLAHARQMFPAATGVRLYSVRFEVPAYPAPARLDRVPIALLAELGIDGTFSSP